MGPLTVRPRTDAAAAPSPRLALWTECLSLVTPTPTPSSQKSASAGG
jgi:hypothetical protein